MKIVKAFGLFALVILIEGILTLKPSFSFTTKQFSLINIDTLLPSLSFIFLFFLMLVVSQPFFKKFKKVFLVLVLILGFLSFLSHLGYLRETPRLPFSFAWKIALGEITASPLFGTGPGQFVQAFLRFKPQEFNTLPFGQFKFTSSSNEYLEILTTTGLLGFGAYVLFLVMVLKEIFFIVRGWKSGGGFVIPAPFGLELMAERKAGIHTNKKNIIFLSSIFYLLFFILLAFFIPFSFLLRMSFVLLITLMYKTGGSENEGGWQPTGRPKIGVPLWEYFWGCWLTGPVTKLVTVFVTAFFLFFLTQYFRAEFSYQQTLEALAKNQAQPAYQKNLESIKLFPFKDSYHLTLSQTSLAWANALSQNSRLTNEEKTLVGQLLAQAVSEGKLAVTLAPNKAQNWENLGLIYKNLIGVASDSDRWSLAAFNNASQLDPTNPVIQLEIGGVYFVRKDYENATKFFQNALVLKPNFSNGFYNLALAYYAQGKNKEAKESIKQAILLTTPGSEDFQKLQKELNAWEE